mmetsp:Transcript_24717/g.56847  ORF Transcript_24717/g.56847 Transcript_24717/m.56847 type:complete len:96 (-) Transcript_24717:1469-1756(-)
MVYLLSFCCLVIPLLLYTSYYTISLLRKDTPSVLGKIGAAELLDQWLRIMCVFHYLVGRACVVFFIIPACPPPVQYLASTRSVNDVYTFILILPS